MTGCGEIVEHLVEFEIQILVIFYFPKCVNNINLNYLKE